ncbi:hypothetical protein [Clostridium formicaceticum]|uniref:DarT domain-containing protein n=1 Tax=Clostridium formicaceticum TaxID=1497 RepID=A0AAC9WEZ6_9CLOT|nr:hypothetical protein [Clostridium formicaceticum]AOY75828.1 hypothetical protein BJL90_07885 [Clostridium formicaceticum]ARE86159.1 hypothetical protein CLFO_04750 [Clostridium formicaceticum]
MFFQDYDKTGVVYHIAHITDLKKILKNGIEYNDKITYEKHYYSFHDFIDTLRPDDVPPWVVRKKAIFASMNYRKEPTFHSHTAVLAVKIDPTRCWIANENRANQIYEPFILQGIEGFDGASNYLQTKGKSSVKSYWETSLSFQENLKERKDLTAGYDAEVMIFHSIPPEAIDILYLVSDHRTLEIEEWKRIFCI